MRVSNIVATFDDTEPEDDGNSVGRPLQTPESAERVAAAANT